MATNRGTCPNMYSRDCLFVLLEGNVSLRHPVRVNILRDLSKHVYCFLDPVFRLPYIIRTRLISFISRFQLHLRYRLAIKHWHHFFSSFWNIDFLKTANLYSIIFIRQTDILYVVHY